MPAPLPDNEAIQAAAAAGYGYRDTGAHICMICHGNVTNLFRGGHGGWGGGTREHRAEGKRSSGPTKENRGFVRAN